MRKKYVTVGIKKLTRKTMDSKVDELWNDSLLERVPYVRSRVVNGCFDLKTYFVHKDGHKYIIRSNTFWGQNNLTLETQKLL